MHALLTHVWGSCMLSTHMCGLSGSLCKLLDVQKVLHCSIINVDVSCIFAASNNSLNVRIKE